MIAMIEKALADANASYARCKAATLPDLGVHTSPGRTLGITDLGNASAQLQQFRAWVYASVRAIAQRIAGQPLLVGEKRRVRNSKSVSQLVPFESHELLTLFQDPNPLMTSWSLIYLTVANLELTGRSLWWLPDRKSIWPLPSSWIVDFNAVGLEIRSFEIRPPGAAETTTIDAEECCYFSLPDPADLHGSLGPLQSCHSAVVADALILSSQLKSLRNGLHCQHALIVGKDVGSMPGMNIRPKLTGPQQRQLIEATQRRYHGLEGAGECLILDGWVEDIKRISLTPAECDWPASAAMMKSRILQAFGVNPIILGEIESANRASSEAADRHFVDTCINPLCRMMSLTMTSWLSSMFDVEQVWIQPAISDDTEASLKWAQLLVQAGAVTGDELRQVCPFDLSIGQFKDAVKPPTTQQPAEKSATELFSEMILLETNHHGRD